MFSTRRASRTGSLVALALFFGLAGLSARQEQGVAVTLAYQFPEGNDALVSHGLEREAVHAGERAGRQYEHGVLSGVHRETEEFEGRRPRDYGDHRCHEDPGPEPAGRSVAGARSHPRQELRHERDAAGQGRRTPRAPQRSPTLSATSSRDLSSGFQAFFPDLPDRAVKQGDTWPSQDSVTQKTGEGDIFISLNHVNTLDGFETIDGIECARIKTESKGTLKGNLEQGGASLTLDGTTTATTTWYFAIKQGFLVKSDGKSGFSGTVAVAQANMTIEVTGESTEEVRLVRK